MDEQGKRERLGNDGLGRADRQIGGWRKVGIAGDSRCDLLGGFLGAAPVLHRDQGAVEGADRGEIGQPGSTLAQHRQQVPRFPRLGLHGGGAEQQETPHAALQLQLPQ